MNKILFLIIPFIALSQNLTTEEIKAYAESMNKDLPYSIYSKICLIVVYDLLYNVRIYIVLPAIEHFIVIPSAGDCFMII